MSQSSGTLAHRRRLRFWGWGYADEGLSADEEARVRGAAARAIGHAPQAGAEPVESDFALPAPRVAPPTALQAIVSATPYDRLTHALGKSFADVVRMRLRQLPHPPDWVAFPKTRQDVVDILDWTARANLAAIPFGGGSSVAGGIEADVGDSYAGAVAIDIQHLNRVLEVDRASRAARIEAGALRPEIED